VLLGELLKGGIEPTPQLIEDLLYEARIHSIASAAGTGKTILAECMCLQVMRKGLPVMYLDAENGPKVIAERLEEMGADPDMLDQLFHYYPAELTLEPDSLAALQTTVLTIQPALVVFDSLADFLGMADMDENSNMDCTRWFTGVVQPIKDADVASLILDHVPKTGKGGPRGASSKIAKMDVQWQLEVTQVFSRDRTGEIKLECTKDRESWLPKSVRFLIGGGMFPSSVETVKDPVDPHASMSGNAKKLYNVLRKAGKEGARWTDLVQALGGSKGNVQRGLKDLGGHNLVDKRDDRYFVSGPIPEEPISISDSGSTTRYHNGTAVPHGTSESKGVPSGTTPLRGGTGGTDDASPNGAGDNRRIIGCDA